MMCFYLFNSIVIGSFSVWFCITVTWGLLLSDLSLPDGFGLLCCAWFPRCLCLVDVIVFGCCFFCYFICFVILTCWFVL